MEVQQGGHRVLIVLAVEEPGHAHDQLLVPVAVQVADGWRRHDMRIKAQPALLHSQCAL